MSDLEPGDILQYQAGTLACGDTRVLALRDQAGRLWVSIEDFLRRNTGWVLSHPRYFDIPYCPSAVVISEGNEVLFCWRRRAWRHPGPTAGEVRARTRPCRRTGFEEPGRSRQREKLSPGVLAVLSVLSKGVDSENVPGSTEKFDIKLIPRSRQLIGRFQGHDQGALEPSSVRFQGNLPDRALEKGTTPLRVRGKSRSRAARESLLLRRPAPFLATPGSHRRAMNRPEHRSQHRRPSLG